LNIKPKSLSNINALRNPIFNDLFTLTLTSSIYHQFDSKLSEIAISLNPISELSYQDYKHDALLRTQKEQITEISKFFKDLVAKYGRIIIYGFNTLPKGLGFPKPRYGTPSPYLAPWSPIHYNTMPDIHKYLVLDQNNINDFSDDFILLLGGFLVDEQTIIVKTEDMLVNEMICGFSLTQGALTQILNPSSDTMRYYAPPMITSHNQEFTNRINDIINSFSEDGVLIPYQRVQKKDLEITIWKYICTQVISYIGHLF
jgi:hypothetical protein